MNGMITSSLIRMFSLDGLEHKIAMKMPMFEGTRQKQGAYRKSMIRRDEKQELV